ncbi:MULTISPECIES: peptide MFS transporter [Legionella]|uniref:Peptide transport protein, POT family n=1 Tax=Legionella drozanskii LLAP-1 TaxID=1212489 RepID=A0A0W0TDK9_9GAMM|nr:MULTISPECIES: oligopeptide:H+ symporter [Legionella]KTC93681.1 peptide transport protein, POT family [Legionella drozanskii LLAP-1]PJE12707.1 MAG: MFS transporter [Legionella sp.]
MSIVENNHELRIGLPQGTISLFFIQTFSILSFSVFYSTLALFITNKLGLSIQSANSITGIFLAANFALHLLGGYWGGRFLSYRALFCLGMCVQIIGCILLATVEEAYFYYGLATFLAGCGLNVTCINCMLTQRFQPKDNQRETAFLWNYSSMNFGLFIGFSLSGYFQLLQDYHRLFLFCSLGNLIALFLCLYFWPVLADQNTSYSRLKKSVQRRFSLYSMGLILTLPLLLIPLLHFANWANKLVLLIGFLMLVTIICLAFQQTTRDAREKMFAFAGLMVVGTVFWTLYLIGPMGLTHFIAHNVERHWLMLTIPPQWFQNINTLCIVIGGPSLGFLLNRMRSWGIKINIPTQFVCALLFIGLAFLVLPIGIARADSSGMVSPGWIIASFILQSAGELLISPIGYAMIGAVAPPSLQGVMMGMWMLGMGVGAALSSYSSNWMTAGGNSISPLITNPSYSSVFLKLGALAIVSSLILLIVVPKLKKWMNHQSDVEKENDLRSTMDSVIISQE